MQTLQEIDDSLYVYGKKGPQKPETSVSDDKFSENSVTSNEEVVSAPKPKEAEPSCVTHVETPKQPMENQGTPKVNGKNWNEMMERKLGEEAELKKQRVFNTDNGVAKQVWNNANRVNYANHFIPRPVQLKSVRQNVNSVRSNVNTSRANVNSVRKNVNSVRFNVNTVRTKQTVPISNSNSFSPVRPQDHPLKNLDDRGICDSGLCSGHMSGNKVSLVIVKNAKGDLLPLDPRRHLRLYRTLDHRELDDDHEYLELPGMPDPEITDVEIVAEDQPGVEDASPTAQSLDYVLESYPEADPEEDDDEDPKEDPVDYSANGGYDGDDEDESSKEDEDDVVDMETDEDDEEEEHPAPADSVVVALAATDQAPSAEEIEAFETDESTATPPPHLAYRVTAKISILAPVPTPAWSDAEVSRLLAIYTPSSSPLSLLYSPLP
ncbi:hypothetical protein Tco_0128836 [Tanacetum coccineum]